MCEGVTLENFGQKKTNFWKKPISGQKIPLVVKSNCLSVCIFEFSDLALCAYSICKSIPFRFTSPMRVYPPFLYLSASADPGIPNHQYNPTKTSNHPINTQSTALSTLQWLQIPSTAIPMHSRLLNSRLKTRSNHDNTSITTTRHDMKKMYELF